MKLWKHFFGKNRFSGVFTTIYVDKLSIKFVEASINYGMQHGNHDIFWKKFFCFLWKKSLNLWPNLSTLIYAGFSNLYVIFRSEIFMYKMVEKFQIRI